MLNEKAPEGAGLFFLLDDFVQQPFPAVFAKGAGKAVRNHFHTFVIRTDAVLISVCKPFFHVHLRTPTGGGFDRNIYPNGKFLFAIFGFPVRWQD
jgi:hypothetical protein